MFVATFRLVTKFEGSKLLYRRMSTATGEFIREKVTYIPKFNSRELELLFSVLNSGLLINVLINVLRRRGWC